MGRGEVGGASGTNMWIRYASSCDRLPRERGCDQVLSRGFHVCAPAVMPLAGSEVYRRAGRSHSARWKHPLAASSGRCAWLRGSWRWRVGELRRVGTTSS